MFDQAIPPESTKFVQMHVKDPKVDFLTVRMRGLALVPAGILNHLHVAFRKKALKHFAQSGTTTFIGWGTDVG